LDTLTSFDTPCANGACVVFFNIMCLASLKKNNLFNNIERKSNQKEEENG